MKRKKKGGGGGQTVIIAKASVKNRLKYLFEITKISIQEDDVAFVMEITSCPKQP